MVSNWGARASCPGTQHTTSLASFAWSLIIFFPFCFFFFIIFFAFKILFFFFHFICIFSLRLDTAHQREVICTFEHSCAAENWKREGRGKKLTGACGVRRRTRDPLPTSSGQRGAKSTAPGHLLKRSRELTISSLTSDKPPVIVSPLSP